jgi:hypothetical protein
VLGGFPFTVLGGFPFTVPGGFPAGCPRRCPSATEIKKRLQKLWQFAFFS